MEITIRRLTPDLTEDYLNFFDNTPHSEIIDDDECKCYCVWWCKDDQDERVFAEYLSTREKRRAYAARSIESGSIQGYLAYSGGEVVGWCNANAKADCLKCFCWRRMGAVPSDEPAEVKVKSVFCFLTAPAHRRKGVSKLLLERVCRDAAQEGFDFVEAYPKKAFVSEAIDFMGPAGLFAKNGFTQHFETDDTLVMRKPLRT